MKDELTEINNRKYLEEILGEIITGEDLNKDNIAFCFLDVDDFKHINDNYGHLVGDQILSIQSLTKRADNNMYESKKKGKNIITVT